MDAISFIIESLKQKKIISPLERDILDTWNELCKRPFDMNAAHQQAVKNDVNHPSIYAQIAALPTTVARPFRDITEDDLRYNLTQQLDRLLEREREVLGNQN